jgi:maltose phosphorylase
MVKTSISPSNIDATADKIQFSYDVLWLKAKIIHSENCGYTVSLNHDNTVTAAEKAIQAALTLGYDHYYKIRLMLGQKFGTCQTLPLMM